jgi:hypothetical protein
MLTTETSPEALISLLSELASLYSRVLALTIGIPEFVHSDEGLLTVIVNDQMVFACPEKSGYAGAHCVRHVSGELGESYINLDLVPGFQYNDNFSYALTLVRTRASEAVEQSYTFHLVHFTDLAYEG